MSVYGVLFANLTRSSLCVVLGSLEDSEAEDEKLKKSARKANARNAAKTPLKPWERTPVSEIPKVNPLKAVKRCRGRCPRLQCCIAQCKLSCSVYSSCSGEEKVGLLCRTQSPSYCYSPPVLGGER